MSAEQVVRKPLTRPNLWRVLFRFLLSPSHIVVVGFVLLSPFILAGLIVIFLRSFFNAPSGAWAIAAIIASSLSAIAGITFLIRDVIRVRQLRKIGTIREVNLWYLAQFLISVKLFIAPAVALDLWSGMQSPDGRVVHGKFHQMSRKEQLRHSLDAVEQRGMWTWIIRGE